MPPSTSSPGRLERLLDGQRDLLNGIWRGVADPADPDRVGKQAVARGQLGQHPNRRSPARRLIPSASKRRRIREGAPGQIFRPPPTAPDCCLAKSLAKHVDCCLCRGAPGRFGIRQIAMIGICERQ